MSQEFDPWKIKRLVKSLDAINYFWRLLKNNSIWQLLKYADYMTHLIVYRFRTNHSHYHIYKNENITIIPTLHVHVKTIDPYLLHKMEVEIEKADMCFFEQNHGYLKKYDLENPCLTLNYNFSDTKFKDVYTESEIEEIQKFLFSKCPIPISSQILQEMDVEYLDHIQMINLQSTVDHYLSTFAKIRDGLRDIDEPRTITCHCNNCKEISENNNITEKKTYQKRNIIEMKKEWDDRISRYNFDLYMSTPFNYGNNERGKKLKMENKLWAEKIKLFVAENPDKKICVAVGAAHVCTDSKYSLPNLLGLSESEWVSTVASIPRI